MSGIRDWVGDQAIDRIQNNMSDEDIEMLIQQGIQEHLVPALQEIRERRRDEPPAQQIRARYKKLDSEQQQQIWQDAVIDVVECAFEIREDPEEGLNYLKDLLRDPWTFEALLLIFENEENIDPEYSETLKSTVSDAVTWIGVAIAPEMYEPETAEQAAQQLGLDVDRRA